MDTDKDPINKDTSFSELIEKHPEIAEFLSKKGMHCIGCPMAQQETIADGAKAHGINPDKLIKEINKKLKKEKK